MKRNERVVYFYDLHVKSQAKHAKVPSLNELYDVWDDVQSNGGFVLQREKGTVTYRIGDMKIENNDMLVMLVRKCDQNAPDATYSNVNTGSFRTAPKKPDEGGDTAAHLCISLKVQTGEPDTYLCLMEGVTGLSHRHVQPLLNNIIRKVCKDDPATFKYAHPSGAKDADGNPVTTSFVPLVELKGHMAENFARDIELGKVTGVELVKQAQQTAVGGSAYLKEKESALRIEVDKKIPPKDRLENIVDAIRQKKNTYDTGRIRFTDRDGKGHTVDIDLNSGSVDQELYIKSYKEENINPALAYSSEDIVDHFSQRLLAKLGNERT